MATENDAARQQATNNKDTASYRWLENAHILLWLVKDTFWAMEWKTGALLMITPTVGVAVYLLWRSRHSRTDVFHNLAVCLWISGNSLWMGGDFFKRDMRPVSVILFITGLAVLAAYYLFYFRKDFRVREEK